jgi:hypothetical protein
VGVAAGEPAGESPARSESGHPRCRRGAGDAPVVQALVQCRLAARRAAQRPAGRALALQAVNVYGIISISSKLDLSGLFDKRNREKWFITTAPALRPPPSSTESPFAAAMRGSPTPPSIFLEKDDYIQLIGCKLVY